jgi:uncharacterized protein RhaS with RHS repeats
MFGTRYYDPLVGRWTQQDPVAGSISDPGTVNRYLYVGNNPVNRIDPTGLGFFQTVAVATGFGGGAGAAVGCAVGGLASGGVGRPLGAAALAPVGAAAGFVVGVGVGVVQLF